MAEDRIVGAHSGANASSSSKTLPSQVGAADHDATLEPAGAAAGDTNGSDAMNMHTSISAVTTTGTASTQGSDIWAIALSDYQAKRAFSEAMPMGADGEDEAVDVFCAAMDHLIERVPAENFDQIRTKIQLALERADGFAGIFPVFVERIVKDLERLGNPLAAFAFVWLQKWTALGGSFFPGGEEIGSALCGCPPYDSSPVAADFELLSRAQGWTNLLDADRQAVVERQRARDEAMYNGGTRQLADLLEAVPGGVAAVRALVAMMPQLGFGRQVEA